MSVKGSGLLRRLFAEPGIIRLAGAHNALGARMAERAGFEGVWSSSFELSASFCVPDASIVTMSEHLWAVEAMRHAVDCPIVADCDSGYGDARNVVRTVRRFEAAGAAAISIEDKRHPKRNSFMSGQELLEAPRFAEKIAAAKSAQTDPDFIVIARVEALIAGRGPEEALERGHAYVDAGADAVLFHSKSRRLAPLAEVLRRWQSRRPVVAVPTTYFRASVDELAELGVKVVIYANHGLRSALRAMEETFGEILATGSSAGVESRIWPLEAVFELQGTTAALDDEPAEPSGELAAATGRPTR